MIISSKEKRDPALEFFQEPKSGSRANIANSVLPMYMKLCTTLDCSNCWQVISMALKSHTQANKTFTKPLDTSSGSNPTKPVKLLDVVHRADVSLTCLRKPCHLEFLFSVTI
jgi:hypothetical protein